MYKNKKQYFIDLTNTKKYFENLLLDKCLYPSFSLIYTPLKIVVLDNPIIIYIVCKEAKTKEFLFNGSENDAKNKTNFILIASLKL